MHCNLNFNTGHASQFNSPLFDSAQAALAAEFSAVASPRPVALGTGPTQPASPAQARNPVSPAIAADYEDLTGLYQKLIDSPVASSPPPYAT